MVTPEAVPYAKTGGLADVTGALIKEFNSAGLKAFLFMPFYSEVIKSDNISDTGIRIRLQILSETIEASMLESGDKDYPAYFIRCDKFFMRKGLYGESSGDYPDNALRFSFFSRVSLEAMKALSLRPDIIHLHDWQTALIPFYLKNFYSGDPFFKDTKTVLTIHNLGYQGIFHPSQLPYMGVGLEYFNPEGLEFYGKVNLLKAGIIYSDAITTVSENYAREILTEEYGFGLDGILRKRSSRLFGILNGIDYELWNPETDIYLPKRYSIKDIGPKRSCKISLLRELSLRLTPEQPLIGFVGRFASQKGVDLIAEAIPDIIRLGAGLIMIGEGDREIEKRLLKEAEAFKDSLYLKTGYDEALARKVYAGSDILLMPSRYEPCGLTQMISMRYGTVPLARATGGLVDTIEDYDHLKEKGSGFLFRGYNSAEMIKSLKRAFCLLRQKRRWMSLVRSVMKKDFSWKGSAGKYIALFRKLKEARL